MSNLMHELIQLVIKLWKCWVSLGEQFARFTCLELVNFGAYLSFYGF